MLYIVSHFTISLGYYFTWVHRYLSYGFMAFKEQQWARDLERNREGEWEKERDRATAVWCTDMGDRDVLKTFFGSFSLRCEVWWWWWWGLVTKSCMTLCDPMDYSLPGSSVHEILQARILKWVAISFSRWSAQPRNRTRVSCIAGGFFANWAMRKLELWGVIHFISLSSKKIFRKGHFPVLLDVSFC